MECPLLPSGRVPDFGLGEFPRRGTSKLQKPSSKLQKNSKSQAPRRRRRGPRAHLGTAPGPRTVPVRSAWAGRSVFGKGGCLRARQPAANRDGSRSGGGGAEMRPRAELGFWAWDFFGVWSLVFGVCISVFGIWCFTPSGRSHARATRSVSRARGCGGSFFPTGTFSSTTNFGKPPSSGRRSSPSMSG